MNNFIFYSPTEFVFGRDTEAQTGALVQKYGARKVMIVYGGGSVIRSGLLARVEKSLQEVGIPYCMLGGVQPNPIDTKVYEGIDLCRKENVDMMLAVGGGSVIDTAKAIAAGVPYNGDFWDFYIGKAIVTKALKVAVVLTIPAAGSEGSGNTVITKVDGLQILSLRAPGVLRPVFAVMNPELTYTLPPFQTACGIADMMAHIMERYFTNTKDVEIGDRLCEGTLLAIIKEATTVMKEPENYGARANLMWCGTIAHNGTCGVGCEEDWASHFLEHEISAIYIATHGAVLSVIFPKSMAGTTVCRTTCTVASALPVPVRHPNPDCVPSTAPIAQRQACHILSVRYGWSTETVVSVICRRVWWRITIHIYHICMNAGIA